MNEKKLNAALELYLKNPRELNAQAGINERSERIAYYSKFTADRIKSMAHDDFYEYIGKLWAMIIWGNKTYIVNKIIEDNGLENLKTALINLLYGKDHIVSRWDNFLKTIKGMGPATISELLTYSNPDEYALFNKSTIACFEYLEIPNLPMYNYQYTGQKYQEICDISKKISAAMKSKGLKENNLLYVDYFLWDEILPIAGKAKKDIAPKEEILTKKAEKESEFIHDEIKEKIINIGNLLGFDSKAEVTIATGAKVDAVWEVSIGNMGKAIYVFEVQTKGSIDSLILNLKKAQTNPAVQAIIAVSDAVQLEKIRQESIGVIEEKSLRLWDYLEVIEVSEALENAHTSINKLKLVPESFIK